jgi:sec-independent protein translocase protein TatB
MFDISWGKLVIIGVVALIFIGPKELPMVLRTVGQWMSKIRRMASEFQGQFQEAMRDAEMADLKKQFDETTSAVQSTFDTSEIKNELEKMIQDPAAPPPASTAATPPSDPTAPAPQTPATANETLRTADPVALGTAPVAPEPAVDLSVPMPELPPPPTSKDFAEAPPAPAAAPAPARPSEPVPEAGGGKAA